MAVGFIHGFLAAIYGICASSLSNVSREVSPSQPHETQNVSNIEEYQCEDEDEVTCHTLGEQSTDNVSDRDSGNVVHTVPKWDTSTSGRKHTVTGKPSMSVSSVAKVTDYLLTKHVKRGYSAVKHIFMGYAETVDTLLRTGRP
ncbi:hypothetical protein PR048_027202 [Dryococelus australis]|uniref:Uncharacterized protein n=1 Tax=Dryococelus australis TaxID=614101 RepID=A0ABQ9GGL1_9NEOP|nr:hypothetical protein PR048_027202 [Dryococelus australis]